MRVSVIIPCYNAAPYLGEAIGSVLAQTRPAAEIIVVDDGSTDGSLEVTQAFGGVVRVLKQKNAGACAARNRGAATASGDALMFLDADDVLGPAALEGLTSALQTAGVTGAVAMCPWYRLEMVDGQWQRRRPCCAPRPARQDVLSAWLEDWFHPPCSVLWSRAAFETAGPWEEDTKVNQDGLLMMRSLALGTPLFMAATGHAYYRRHPNEGATVSGQRYTREGLASRLRVLNRVAATLGDRAESAPLRWSLGMAYGVVAADCRGRFKDLYRQSLEKAERYGGPAWRRITYAGRRYVTRKVLRLRNRLMKTDHLIPSPGSRIVSDPAFRLPMPPVDTAPTTRSRNR